MRAFRGGWWAALFLLVICLFLVYFGWIREAEQRTVPPREVTASSESTASDDLDDWLSALDSGDGGGSSPVNRNENPERVEDEPSVPEIGEPDNMSLMGVSDGDLRVCVYDIAGTAGNNVRLLNHWRAAADKQTGTLVALTLYTDPWVLLEDFKNGECTAAFVPGKVMAELNAFTYTISAYGGISSPGQLAELLRELREPEYQKKLAFESGEVVGILPAGGARLVRHDSDARFAGDLAGLSVGVTFDRASQNWMAGMGMTPVVGDNVGTLIQRFQQGVTEAIVATLGELLFILGPDFGERPIHVLEPALYQSTWQLVVAKGAWSDDFTDFTREFFDTRVFELALKYVNDTRQRYESHILALSGTTEAQIRETSRELRTSGRDDIHYDPAMLGLLKAIGERTGANQ